ncbi:G-alpha-domain-containing protein [Epithele typhae]|uniref:G-alpha-domain-containing protein n=1 Tax=Epithele typhae TaxID=378194 RepID=UPI002007BB89|nr:G-alpha-domain-containing protein [Epithele typhae]KAH9941145.1 G-alpha-domain-containing protein [Epithele typhae]
MPAARIAPDRDPLAAALRPPIDETDEEKAVRVASEEAAKRVSHAIDEAIRLERQQRKKHKLVRLLLLGQSESGKSTTLRQFQRLYTPNAFREERILWRAVIQLNIVRSIHNILDTLTDIRRRDVYEPSVYTSDPDSDSESENHVALPPHLEELRRRLYPLRHVESLLIAKLCPPNDSEATTLGYGGSNSVNGNVSSHWSSPPTHALHNNEVFVRPGAAWKRVTGRPQSAGTTGQETIDECQTMLHHCRADIVALWNDSIVRHVLRRRKVRIEDSPGFYLNDIDRVTAVQYFPSEDDVLRARLKTVGVSEYSFHMEAGDERGTEWRIIDVGGSRSQVPTWVPFFDDAIIFLAPISAFDQVLAEDRSVNRLEDSVLLWKELCSNKLLAKVDLVLFLNKCDILESKLKSGVRLAKYVRSFGERPNDPDVAQKYFKSKFSAIHREHSPIPRKFYGFCTSVTDSTTTGGIIAAVKDMVLREHLRASKLL